MKNKIRMGFAAAFTVFTLSIMPVQAGGETPSIKGGIADLRYVKTKMTVNVSASNKTTARNADEGSGKSAETVTDTNPDEIPTTEPSTCDFGGFAQNDVVNNAYAGGASSTGVAKADIQIGYFDARVLKTYFGANEPNPGIAYTNTGSILVSLQNIAGTNFAFSYTCAVQLTVRTFSSVDGSGTALNTYTLVKNLPGTMGPYNVWTNFSQPIDATVRSISISGDPERWGMDQMVVTRNIPLGTNDGLTCANALSYGAGTYSIDTSNAYDDPSGNCNVKWVTFFATQNGQVNASTCGYRNYDTMLTAYTGCGTTYIARNDDYCSLGSQISFSVLAGQQYWVALGGWNCYKGLSDLTISGPIAANLSPTIASVSPTYGWQFGGTAFTLTGTNFTGATSVKIGGVAATSLVVVSATQITAVTPFSSTFGAKDVVVTTPAGSFTAVASFTYTAAVPVLALTNNAGSCNPIGAVINVDATLSGVVSPIVAGQIYITWNPAKMTLNYPIDAGDAPFIQVHTINRPAGTALILVSLEQGGSAISVQSKVVARMHFTVVGGSCDGSGTDIQFFPDGTLPTEFTDGVGGKMVPALVASSVFTVDDGAPVLSNVPPRVWVPAEAGMGSYANVALTPPTATDACSPLTQTAVRSDGASLGAAFPVGTTTVTWSATDPCANTTTATTLVTVNNANTATFAVSYSGGYPASSSRNLALDIHGDNGNNARSTSAMFAAGTASFSITDLAIATYDCVSIRDIGHSLRRRVAMSDVGTDWSATATLIAGDLNGNDVIDVVDWGMYIVGNSNADLDGNGVISSDDGAIIIANFGQQSDAICGGALMGPPEPISAISVAELVDLGMADLAAADLNNDGWLDMEDVRISGN